MADFSEKSVSWYFYHRMTLHLSHFLTSLSSIAVSIHVNRCIIETEDSYRY